jgi:hypothetical protein
MENRLQDAIECAKRLNGIGAELSVIINNVKCILQQSGDFGKILDRSVRRAIKSGAGYRLMPGECHGKVLEDGAVNYRS